MWNNNFLMATNDCVWFGQSDANKKSSWWVKKQEIIRRDVFEQFCFFSNLMIRRDVFEQFNISVFIDRETVQNKVFRNMNSICSTRLFRIFIFHLWAYLVGDHNIVGFLDVTQNDIFGYQIFISNLKCVPPHPPFKFGKCNPSWHHHDDSKFLKSFDGPAGLHLTNLKGGCGGTLARLC